MRSHVWTCESRSTLSTRLDAGGSNPPLGIAQSAGDGHLHSSSSMQRTKYDWRQEVGKPLSAENLSLFHSYVDMAYHLLEDYNSADFIYSDVIQMCKPAYLFSVICDMRGEKLSMRIYQTDSGIKAICIHKVHN